MANYRPRFHLFLIFSPSKVNFNFMNQKSVDAVLGIRAYFRRSVCQVRTTQKICCYLYVRSKAIISKKTWLKAVYNFIKRTKGLMDNQMCLIVKHVSYMDCCHALAESQFWVLCYKHNSLPLELILFCYLLLLESSIL